MSNGQLNTVSVQTIAPFVTQNLVVAATPTIDGAQKQAGDFAELLGGFKLLSAAKVASESGETETSEVNPGVDQVIVDAGVEQRMADLLALIQTAHTITPTSPSTAINADDSETAVLNEKTESQRNEQSDVSSLMALAAYVQSGRIPDVNITMVPPVDGPQKEAVRLGKSAMMATESEAVKPAQQREKEMVTEDNLIEADYARQRARNPVLSASVSDVIKPIIIPAEDGQKIAGPSLQVANVFASNDTAQKEQITVHRTPQVVPLTVQPVHVFELAESKVTQGVESQPTKTADDVYVKTAQSILEVNKTTQVSVDESTKTVTSVKQPTIIASATTNRPVPATSELTQPVGTHQTLVVLRNDQSTAEKIMKTVSTSTMFSDGQSPAPTAPDSTVMNGTVIKTSEVSKPAQPFAETLLDAVVTADQHIVNTEAIVVKESEQSVAEQTQTHATELKPAATWDEKTVAGTVKIEGQHLQTGIKGDAVVDGESAVVPAQPVALMTGKAVHVVDEPVSVQNQRITNDVIRTALTENKPLTAVSLPQVEVSRSASEVSKSTPLPVDQIQIAASTPVHQPDDVQTALVISPTPESELDIQLSQPRPITARVTSVLPDAVNRAAGPGNPHLTSEAWVDKELSQPRPITARVTSVLPDAVNRAAGPGNLHLTSETWIDKARTNSEKSNVKDMTPSLQLAATVGESMVDSDSSGSFEGDFGQSDSTSDGQLLAQNMRGQLGADHQKVVSTSGKFAQPESARQDVPEQVMQHVKERLVQHDVKAGSQQITLTLSPDSLGELKVNLNLQGQKLSVEIVAENRTVRDAIVQHTDSLKESLSRQNITMESFDVTTGGKGTGQGQNQNAWRELAKQQQQQQIWLSPRGYQTAHADVPAGKAAYQKQHGQSMLDIHY
ncbi:MAG: flagellar hook-length control protein FliK [Desulfuromonadaceae bacterium]|nr:flagellar hook-length control protein FliK [Desulfuromonadaceae bacterium]